MDVDAIQAAVDSLSPAPLPCEEPVLPILDDPKEDLLDALELIETEIGDDRRASGPAIVSCIHQARRAACADDIIDEDFITYVEDLAEHPSTDDITYRTGFRAREIAKCLAHVLRGGTYYEERESLRGEWSLCPTNMTIAQYRSQLDQEAKVAERADEAPKTITVLSCAKSKQDLAPEEKVAAKDLYVSPGYRKARAYAESLGHEWAIVSALHHGLHPDDEIGTYEKTVNKMRMAEKRRWGIYAAQDLIEKFDLRAGDTAIVLAGATYLKWMEPTLLQAGIKIEQPLRGLGQGQRLQRLNELLAATVN